ncbi:MAG: TonB-dependent siderophore receptor [Coleofasciculaceae cyanobacterium]
MKLYLPFLYAALVSIGIMPPVVAKPLTFAADATPNQASAVPIPEEEIAKTSANPPSSQSSQSPNVDRQSSITEIPRLSEIKRPLTSVEGLFQESLPTTADSSPIAQVEAEVIKVTGVRLNSTGVALEVILETSDGTTLQTSTSTEDNTLIADIPNAVLALPDGDGFRANNPAEGIISVTVTQLNTSSVRVTVTGETGVPTSQVVSSPSGLVLSLTPADGESDESTEDSDIEADAEDDIEIVVTGEQDEGYRVPNATTATKTDALIRDVPQSIQVVPREVLDDQQVTQITDALRNVSGTSSRFSSLRPDGDAPNIRGFSSFDYFFTNGIRNLGGGGAFQNETANVERIEVLKGPASVLYGQGEPGGLVNLVTKLPTSQPFFELEGTIGNFNFYRSRIDISGPLNDDKTIGYRLNAQYQNSGTFVDFVDVERFFVAPVLRFELGKDTSLILEANYLRDSRLIYPGLPAVGTVLPNPLGEVPRSRYLGEPDFGNVTYENINAGYRLEHQFSENLSIRNAFKVEIANVVNRDLLGLGRLLDDNRTVNRNASTTSGGTQTYSLVTDVLGKVQTGSVKHDLLFGVELRRQNESFDLSFGGGPIDLFNPVYGSLDFGLEKGYDATQVRNYLGVYGQDLIAFSDNFKLLLGGRFDLVNQKYEGKLDGESTLSQEDSQFSPRVGIVYQPVPPVSLYASWSRSFFPQGDFGDRNTDGSPFKPTTGEQFEVGVKTEFLDGKLAATLAAYQITKQNVLTDDPNRPNFRIQIGEQQSQGIEFDLVGEVLPGLKLIASYAYTDAEITQDNSGFVGNQPNNVPRHSGSIWTTYQIQTGQLEGLGFGLGVFVVGDRKGDLANTFELPGYTRTDASIFYRRDRWKAAVNVKNLFGVDYFENAISRNSVSPGAPFTILGTVSISF